LEFQGQLWVDEPELDEPQSLAILSTIIVKEHIEELEEMPSSPKNEEAPTTLQVGESSGCNLQEVIFNLSPRYQLNFLSMFKCPLTHIVLKGESFRDRTKLYHSLFPHAYPLNSLVQVLEWNNLTKYGIKMIEIQPGKTLNINSWLTNDQEMQLFNVLKENEIAYAWEYSDMKGIDLRTCQHHIYINNSKPIQQHPRWVNPALRDIIKEEIKKLLKVNFIFPISDSKRVSPLVIVPKKNGKWRVCVDYRALNKATHRDHFSLPFIDQVLDTLAGKKYFSFLDGFSGYNQIQIAEEDQEKTTFTCA